jgi:hypothetical protein
MHVPLQKTMTPATARHQRNPAKLQHRLTNRGLLWGCAPC